MAKFFRWMLDALMFVVPILELTEFIQFIPMPYLPWYMLSIVILRRILRMLEEKYSVPN